MDYVYHHMGIPCKEKRPGERYSPTMKMYTSGGEAPWRVQHHRFEEGCPLHPLIQSMPHVAFKVDSIDRAIEGKRVLLGPYFPMKDFRVAIIEEQGAVIEFIETSLSEEEIWNDELHQDSILYPEG